MMTEDGDPLEPDEVEPPWECGVCAKIYNGADTHDTEVLLDACVNCLRDRDDPLAWAISRLLDRHSGFVLRDEVERSTLAHLLLDVILFVGDYA